MEEHERKDAIAPGTVAIAGVMAICNVLAAKGIFERADIDNIGEFMLGAVDRSEATPQMQAHLQQALSHHLATLLDAMGRTEK